jgi:short-subunit dehydrogenase
MAPIELRGRPIAITGASSGIGRATALACAGAGMPVAVAARREDRLAEVVEEIARAGGRAVAVGADVTDPRSCERLVARTVEAFGSIYAVYANAGYGMEKAVHLMSDVEIRAMFETNFFGTLNTIRPALPHMLAARAGHILICSSCIGKIGVPYYGAYCASKGAQSLIGRAMRHELEGAGIHVSTVHPVRTTSEFSEVARRIGGGGERLADQTPAWLVQSAGRVADATVACLRRPRPEVWTSFSTRLSFALASAFPRLADGPLRRFARAHQRLRPRA